MEKAKIEITRKDLPTYSEKEDNSFHYLILIYLYKGNSK